MDVAGLAPGPAQLVLTATVAQRYYVDGRSKVEIADELKISRFKVARMLEHARASGLVRIEIGHPGGLDGDLSGRLRDALGLRTALVVDLPTPGAGGPLDASTLRATLGRVAAGFLTESVCPDDVVGLAWSRSVAAMVPALSAMAPAHLVQLTGSLRRGDISATSTEIIREIAKSTGSSATVFYAPFLLPDLATAEALRRHPDIARATDWYARVTTAVVGLGRWSPELSTLYDAMSPEEQRDLSDAGAVADLSGVFVDESGAVVGEEHTARMITMPAEQLRHVGEVVAVASGVERVPAVRAAAASGLVTTLVTHTAVARALLG